MAMPPPGSSATKFAFVPFGAKCSVIAQRAAESDDVGLLQILHEDDRVRDAGVEEMDLQLFSATRSSVPRARECGADIARRTFVPDEFCADHAGEGLERDISLPAGKPLGEARKATRAVAAHLGFAAVRIVIAHLEIRAIRRRFHRDQSVAADRRDAGRTVARSRLLSSA